MRAYQLGLFVTALLGASIASAGESPVLAAWRGVVAHSPEYAAALARRDAGRATGETARALWMPTLSAAGGVALSSLDSDTAGAQFTAPGFGTRDGVDFRTSIHGGTATDWQLLAQQPLLDASRVADTQEARARARLADAQFRQNVQMLMLRTAEAFATVVQTGARFHAVQRLRQVTIRAQDMARARFESGDLPVTEWREAQAEADQLAVQELDVQQAFAVANEAYSNLTGLPPPPDPAVNLELPAAGTQPPMSSPTATLAADPGTQLSGWLQQAQDHSPVLALQTEQQRIAEAQLRRWSQLDSAKLSLVGQYGRQSLSGSGYYGDASATQRDGSIGLQLTVPIFTGGLRTAQRHAAEASVRAAEADLAAAQQQVDLQVRSAWQAVGTARARVQAMLRAQQSADTRLDATRTGHDAGDRTVLDLLAAEGSALQARAGTMQARCETLLASLRLAAAAGILDESFLADDGAGGGSGCGVSAAP